MAVLGIDFGSSGCVIATVSRGAVEIVRNEVSERVTPSIVAYTEKERLMGDQAQSQVKSNYRNTVRGVKHALGRVPSDPAVKEVACKQAFSEIRESPDGDSGYAVTYKSKAETMSACRTTAALFTKLKHVARKSTSHTVHDVVISAPGWYNDSQRHALINAAEIAGLPIRRLMNDYTATALDYGIYRSVEFDEAKPTRVCFVSLGHCTCSVSIVDYIKGSLKVMHEVSDPHLGGWDADEALLEECRQTFLKSSGNDIFTNSRSRFKVEEACSKAKKVLSANAEAKIGVECLIGDEDLNYSISRAEFETLCEPLAQRLTDLIQRCFTESKIEVGSVECVEIVGRGSLMPWAQQRISEVFGKRPGRTLHIDECVARGCALQAAMCSSLFKVREFGVLDVVREDIWVEAGCEIEGFGGDDIKSGGCSGVIFAKNSPTVTSKYITVRGKESFELKFYSKKADNGTEFIGKYQIVLPPHLKNAPEKSLVKIRCKVNHSGVFTLLNAVLVEHIVVEKETETSEQNKSEKHEQTNTEKNEEKNTQNNTENNTENNTDQNKTKQSPDLQDPKGATQTLPKEKRTVLETKLIDTPIGRLEKGKVIFYAEEEKKMDKEDAHQEATRDKLNELESFSYDLKDGITQSGELFRFITEDAIKEVETLLENLDSWLYDFGPEADMDALDEKLQSLKNVTNEAFEKMQTVEKTRNEYLPKLVNTIETAQNAFKSEEAKYAHISEDMRSPIQTEIDSCIKLQKDIIQVIDGEQNLKGKELGFSLQLISTKSNQLNSLVANIMAAKPPCCSTPNCQGEKKTEKNDEKNDQKSDQQKDQKNNTDHETAEDQSIPCETNDENQKPN